MGKVAAKRYVIDEEQLRAICEIASKAGVEAYKEEQVKSQKEREKKVKNSAKTLVMNYRRFKDMCENSVYDAGTSNEMEIKEIIELMSGKFRNHEFEIMSIKEKVARTKMIMEHVDAMLMIYKNSCYRSADPNERRRWRVINAMYLSGENLTAQEVADAENIDLTTVYRDCNNAYRKLAVLFFGIDGIRS